MDSKTLLQPVLLYLKPKLLAIFCLGFASGLPLALTASTLFIWLTESDVDKTSIGLFALAATPYALKFLWSPLVDGIRIPFLCNLLGRRRGWLFAVQLFLMAAIIMLGFADPAVNPWFTALAALVVAIGSASQDIVIDAYRVELLAPEEQGAGSAMVVLGYRFGMIAASAGALFMAEDFGWTFSYIVMALLLLVGTLAALWIGEPVLDSSLQSPISSKKESGNWKQRTKNWMIEHVIEPFVDFMKRDQWLTILLFILLYKLADAFMGVMTNPFLIEIGFTKTQIATVVKLYGLLATIAGSFIGGAMVYRLGLMRTLWLVGIACGLTNLAFMLQAQVGANISLLAAVITMENLSSGMSAAAFVAYISSLTNIRFTATQYALLSSLAAFGRTWLSAPAGWFAESLGWEWFFVMSAALAIPGLWMLMWLQSGGKNSEKAT